MKKLLALLFVLVLLAAAIPVVGNKLVENTLNEKIELLSAHGIEVKSENIDASYLQTKKHYEFLLKDSEKFLAYLNQNSHREIPPYVNEMVDGILLGADVEYNNIPFVMNAIEADVYVMSLSKNMMQEMKNEDAEFYAFVNSFFEKKGILYHLQYDVITRDFNGYIKDIREQYTLKDDTNVSIDFSGMNYKGSGDLLAPNIISSNVERISLIALKDTTELRFDLAGFSSASEFESKSRYSSSASLENIALIIKGEENIAMYSKDLKMSLSSDTQESFAKMYAKSNFKEFGINTRELNVKVYDLNYDISLSDLDKDALEELQDVVTQAKQSPSNSLELQVRESLIKLLSRGLVLGIDDLSFKKLLLDDTKDLQGISIHSQIFFKEDAALANKLLYTPVLLIQNLDSDIKIKISKEIFNKINENAPMTTLAMEYAKVEGENYVFEISFHNGELLVNGRVLKS
ncbi:MAG: DUF945 domain-containing protein [Sulfurimonas sp.]|nr:DUF945 domain-containing protein [Sulfurimonas sp.]MBU1217651.1 YdgA family protein [bacterium]MBU1434321.1 YdgA family protein [bacterium]MBU1503712.1 YdgA family protein [bacterium]MBU3939530.1 YdgA family protein [bacterium]